MSELFPELRDRQGEGPAAAATKASGTVSLALGPRNKALRGAAYTLERYRQLLDLPATDGAGPRIVEAQALLRNGHIEITLEGEDIGRITALLIPHKPSPEEPGTLQLGLVGPVKNEAVRALLANIQQRLGRAPFRLLLKVFRLDPERKWVTLPPLQGEGFDDEAFRRSLVRFHGSPDAWRLFFAELEQQRNFNHHLAGKVLVVRHEDIECNYATPSLSDPSPSFFRYPMAHRARPDSEQGHEDEVPAFAHGGPELATDLVDLDVIRGGAGKLDALLDRIAALDEKPDLVLVKAACVPKVIGDDMTEAMARFERRTGVATAYLDNLADEDANLLSSLLARLRWEPEFREPGEKAGRVNLVGYPEVAGMKTLMDLLEEQGVVVNARLVPTIHLEDVRRYTWAELQVLFDSRFYQPTFEHILGDVDMRSIRPKAPFGVAASRAWLEAVAGAVGRQQGLDAAWARLWEPLQARWEALCAQAQGQRIGFVVDRRSADNLLHPEKVSGVPMLEVLQEMGFALEFLCWAGDDMSCYEALPGSRRTFDDAAGLAGELRNSPAPAFYSELSFDSRLSRSGKGQLSVADFELGVEGALSTLGHLLCVCRTSFQRRYAPYLGDAFASPVAAATAEDGSTEARWGNG